MARNNNSNGNPVTELTNIQDTLDVQTAKDKAAELINLFDGVDLSKLQTLTSEYLQFKENTTYSFIFLGMQDFESDNGIIPACRLIDRENKEYINANKVLTGSLSKVTTMPCLVKIVTQKEKKGANGTYLMMDVFIIPQKIAK